MKKFVVDASVVAKWFIPEIHSAAAVRYLDLDAVLYAPDLIHPELGNILWKKVRRGELTGDDSAEILAAFRHLPLEIRSSAALIEAAFELAVNLDRSVYDSLYLALAVIEECALITADAKFHAAVTQTTLADYVRWVADEI